MSSDDASSVLMSWWRLGHVSVKSWWCVFMVLWCLWWWVGDGLVLSRWGCGAVFFLWWWCFDCLVMNIDEHFDRVSKQNLKFQFEFVYCAPLGKPVKLWPVCRRRKLQDWKFMLSVVSRSCLRDVSVLVLRCLGDVSGCHGDVSVLFSWCFTDVAGMSRWCFGDVSVLFQWCHGDVSVLFS